MTHFPIPEELTHIVSHLNQAGGRCMLVGGAVRDYLRTQSLGHDLDVEVYQLSANQLQKALKSLGHVCYVGNQFGVWKLTTDERTYDFSLPRTENKVGRGHKGFEVVTAPTLTFKEAAARRDFTINAIGYDLQDQVLHDPYGGVQDLVRKQLKHVGPAFSEDPLRVLRAMQFSGRFEFEIAPETVELCRQLDLSELPKERLFAEFKKLLLLAEKPSVGLEAAKTLGILSYFPELAAVIDVPQDPEWHPEGDVWIHTLMTVDEAAKLRTNSDEKQDLALMFGLLCHDFGKALTTEKIDGRWRSLGHEKAGVPPTESFLRRLTDETQLIETVVTYVKEHLKPALLYNERDRVSDGAIRRLALRVSIPDIVRVAQADHFGRTTPDAIAREFSAGSWLLERAAQLNVQSNKPKPLLLGRHLLPLGVPAGPEMGKLLQAAFQAQLDGAFSTETDALQWIQNQLN